MAMVVGGTKQPEYCKTAVAVTVAPTAEAGVALTEFTVRVQAAKAEEGSALAHRASKPSNKAQPSL
jgi:hypothetical protein